MGEAAVQLNPELSAEIPSVLFALAVSLKHASRDYTRPHLNSVLVEGRGDKLVFVATDGHRLSKVTIPGRGDGTYLLPFEAVQNAHRALKALPKHLRSGGHVELTDTSIMWPTGRADYDPVDERFPPYEKVIPSDYAKRDASPTVGVNLPYLADLSAALPKGDKGAKPVRIHIGGPLDPVVIVSEYPDLGEVLAVVMPMRI